MNSVSRLAFVIDRARILAPSALTFIAGSGALILADIVLARAASPEIVHDWVVFRSLIFPLSTIALLGFDQVIVREPSKAALFLKPAIPLVVGIAAALAAGSYLSGYYGNIYYIFLATLGVAGSSMLFGYFRARLLFNSAQVARDSWKAIFLLLLVPLHFALGVKPEVIVLGSMAITFMTLAVPMLKDHDSPMREVHDEVFNLRSALSVSWPFGLASLSLSLAAYGELILMRIFGTEQGLTEYFKAVVLFTYPIVVLNTYLSTFLGSAIRQDPARYSRMALHHKWSAVILLVLACPLAMMLGVGGSYVLFPGYRPDYLVAATLSLTAGMRLGYTFLSSFIGTLATKTELKLNSILYFSFACLTPLICYGLLQLLSSVALAVSLTALIHWLLRSSIGWRLSWRLCSRHASV